jgi:hypothetical protein
MTDPHQQAAASAAPSSGFPILTTGSAAPPQTWEPTPPEGRHARAWLVAAVAAFVATAVAVVVVVMVKDPSSTSDDFAAGIPTTTAGGGGAPYPTATYPTGSYPTSAYQATTTRSTSTTTYPMLTRLTTTAVPPDYSRLRLEFVQDSGGTQVVEWEFRYRDKEGNYRQAFGRYWRLGQTDYVVYGSAPMAAWSGMRPVLETVMATATPR